MGSGAGIRCINCHYSFDAMTGVGMMYSSLSNVMFAIHHKRRPIVEDILNNHIVQKTEYEHRVYRCSKCGKFAGRFYIKILYDFGETYETEFKCSKCKNLLDDVPEDLLSRFPCPECKQMTLQETQHMMWD